MKIISERAREVKRSLADSPGHDILFFKGVHISEFTPEEVNKILAIAARERERTNKNLLQTARLEAAIEESNRR